jgi:type II secretory pathway pseudopilin PulG
MDARGGIPGRQGRGWFRPPPAAVVMLVLVGATLLPALLIGIRPEGGLGRRLATAQTLRTVGSAVKAYSLESGRFPATLAELVDKKYFDRHQRDAWDRELTYAVPGTAGRPFTLMSAGPDGAAGTEDDVDFHTMREDES